MKFLLVFQKKKMYHRSLKGYRFWWNNVFLILFLDILKLWIEFENAFLLPMIFHFSSLFTHDHSLHDYSLSQCIFFFHFHLSFSITFTTSFRLFASALNLIVLSFYTHPTLLPNLHYFFFAFSSNLIEVL